MPFGSLSGGQVCLSEALSQLDSTAQPAASGSADSYTLTFTGDDVGALTISRAPMSLIFWGYLTLGLFSRVFHQP